MGKYAGQGGAVRVIGSPAATVIGVGKWKLGKKKALANTTNSTSGGIKQRTATVKDQTVTFEMPWESSQDPTDLGFDEGAEISVSLDLGSSGKKWSSSAVVIESVEYSTDFDEDVIRLTIVGYANSAFALT